jgi:hypothetical protein
MKPRAEYADLVGLWWDLVELYEITDHENRVGGKWDQHDVLFTKTLIQCGWTLEEWNWACDADVKASK